MLPGWKTAGAANTALYIIGRSWQHPSAAAQLRVAAASSLWLTPGVGARGQNINRRSYKKIYPLQVKGHYRSKSAPCSCVQYRTRHLFQAGHLHANHCHRREDQLDHPMRYPRFGKPIFQNRRTIYPYPNPFCKIQYCKDAGALLALFHGDGK